MSKPDLKQFFTKTSLQGSKIQVFEAYLTLFFENGLYTDELYQKLVRLLNSKISLAKQGFLLQFLTWPPYRDKDILKYEKEKEYYSIATDYYIKKTKPYENKKFEKRYNTIFYNAATNSDNFLINASHVKEICWDGFVISAEDTIPRQKLAKLFVKRLNLIVFLQKILYLSHIYKEL